MHGFTEEDGQSCAQHPKGGHLKNWQKFQLQRIMDGVAVNGVEAETMGHQRRCIGRQQTGNHGGVVHPAYRDYLHSKHNCCKRGSEQCGKGGGHAAHHYNSSILLVQVKKAANVGGQGGAQLKGGALTPSRTTHQMGQDSRKENQGRCTQL